MYPVIFANRSSHSLYASQRIIPKGNVAAVEPFIHTLQKTTSTTNTAKQSQQHQYTQQLIQEFVNLKMHFHQSNENNISNRNIINPIPAAESDETKLARQRIIHMKHQSQDMEIITNITDFGLTKYSLDPKSQSKQSNSHTIKSGLVKNVGPVVQASSATSPDQQKQSESNDSDSTKAEIEISLINSKKQPSRLKEHSDADGYEKSKSYAKQQILWSNLVVPPRKPISCVAPTNITHSANPRVLAVAPNINKAATQFLNENDKQIPALPPKPSKNTENDTSSPPQSSSKIRINSKLTSEIDRQRIRVPTFSSTTNKVTSNETSADRQSTYPNTTNQLNVDNLPIKAKPLTIRKQPMSEQPRLRSMPSNLKNVQYGSRRIEMPPAFLFPEIEEVPLKADDGIFHSETDTTQLSLSEQSNSSSDDTDKSNNSSVNGDEKLSTAILLHDEMVRRPRSSLSDNNKVKLTRRVSFDPLALLLDASLEGELELVKKTAIQVIQQNLVYTQ